MANKNKMFILLGILVGALLIVSLAAQYANHPPMPKAEKTEETANGEGEQDHGSLVGMPAPDFTLPTLEAKNIKLSDFKDKNSVLLLMVGANSTIAEDQLKVLNSLEKKYGPQGFKPFVIAMMQHLPEARALAKKTRYKSTMVVDPNGTISMQYVQAGEASCFLINKDGTVYKTLPRVEPKLLEADAVKSIEDMLSGKPAATPEEPGMGADNHNH
ncbi:MAG: peroxiredoxin family protein [Armatimonadota bacterium]